MFSNLKEFFDDFGICKLCLNYSKPIIKCIHSINRYDQYEHIAASYELNSKSLIWECNYRTKVFIDLIENKLFRLDKNEKIFSTDGIKFRISKQCYCNEKIKTSYSRESAIIQNFQENAFRTIKEEVQYENYLVFSNGEKYELYKKTNNRPVIKKIADLDTIPTLNELKRKIEIIETFV